MVRGVYNGQLTLHVFRPAPSAKNVLKLLDAFVPVRSRTGASGSSKAIPKLCFGEFVVAVV